MPTLEEIGKKIERTLPEIAALPAKLELFSAQESFAIFMARTFSTGGAKDADGNLLKPYTAAYKKVRENHTPKLQTDFKDLQVSGKLFRSINPGVSQGRAAMGITNEDSAKISEYQEEQNGSLIFVLGTQERATVIEKTNAYLIENLRNIIAGWR